MRVRKPADALKAREKMGLSQEELAKLIRLPDTQSIRRWERGTLKNGVPGPVQVLYEALLSGFRPLTSPFNDGRLPSRFWEKTYVQDNGCWGWRGEHFTHNGYARFWLNKRHQMAHRVAYEALIGAIEDGMVCDHLCRNRGCVNPEHIEIVTSAENTRRGDHRKIKPETCKRGHDLEGDNVIYGKKTRQCRRCANDNRNVRRAKRKGK